LFQTATTQLTGALADILNSYGAQQSKQKAPSGRWRDKD
jgi:hypothetical protein